MRTTDPSALHTKAIGLHLSASEGKNTEDLKIEKMIAFSNISNTSARPRSGHIRPVRVAFSPSTALTLALLSSTLFPLSSGAFIPSTNSGNALNNRTRTSASETPLVDTSQARRITPRLNFSPLPMPAVRARNGILHQAIGIDSVASVRRGREKDKSTELNKVKINLGLENKIRTSQEKSLNLTQVQHPDLQELNKKKKALRRESLSFELKMGKDEDRKNENEGTSKPDRLNRTDSFLRESNTPDPPSSYSIPSTSINENIKTLSLQDVIDNKPKVPTNEKTCTLADPCHDKSHLEHAVTKLEIPKGGKSYLRSKTNEVTRFEDGIFLETMIDMYGTRQVPMLDQRRPFIKPRLKGEKKKVTKSSRSSKKRR